MSKKPQGYVDLYSLEEDARIELIGRTVVEEGKTVAVMIDSQPAKIARYINKLKQLYPGAILLEQIPGPVKDVVTLKFGPQ